MRRAMIGAAAALAAFATMSSTVEARNSYTEQWSVVDEFEFTCGDDDVLIEGRAEVSGSLSVVRRGDGLAYFTEAVRGTETFTNTETGKTYTHRFASGFHDLEVVDNGDGTLTIIVQGAGADLFFDGSGRFALSNNGMNRVAILIDHGGTPGDPTDDEFITVLDVVKPSTGTNDTEGRDFCEDILLFTS